MTFSPDCLEGRIGGVEYTTHHTAQGGGGRRGLTRLTAVSPHTHHTKFTHTYVVQLATHTHTHTEFKIVTASKRLRSFSSATHIVTLERRAVTIANVLSVECALFQAAKQFYISTFFLK